jgi:hypothetical protein
VVAVGDVGDARDVESTVGVGLVDAVLPGLAAPSLHASDVLHVWDACDGWRLG